MTEPRRIRPPREFESMIDKLVENGVFESKQAVMMFASALGHRFGGRAVVVAPGDGIRWYTFQKAGDDAYVNALAIADKNDINVLDPDTEENEHVQLIFEEYAARGLRYLKQHVYDSQGDPLDLALGIVQDYQLSQQPTPVGLEGLDRATLELLGDFN